MHASTIDRRRRRDRLVLSAAAVLASTAVFGVGASASFTTSTAAEQTVSSGTVALELGADGTAANQLTVAATDVAPGDTIQRTVDLLNTGSLDLAAVTLTTSATTSSLLDTDPTNGLQLVVESCPVTWTETVTEQGTTTACSDVVTTVVASRPVIGADLDLGAIAALSAGTTSHLRVTLTLPQTADNTFQGQSSVIDYTFAGVQRAGMQR